jgi:hypothetical protein
LLWMWRYGQVDEQLLHELQKTGEEGCRIYGIWNNLHADVSGDVLGRAWGMTGIIGDVTVFRCRCTSYTRSCEPPTPPPSEATRRAAAALCVRMGPDICRPRAFPPLAFPPSIYLSAQATISSAPHLSWAAEEIFRPLRACLHILYAPFEQSHVLTIATAPATTSTELLRLGPLLQLLGACFHPSRS